MSAAPQTPESDQGHAARVNKLRGELWRQHASLRKLGPADAQYADEVGRALELTDELLAAEAESDGLRRAGRRRVELTVYAMAAALITLTIVGVSLLPGLGGWLFRAVDAAALVDIVLIALVLLRQRHRWDGSPSLVALVRWPGPSEASTASLPVPRRSPEQASVDTEPATGPLPVVTEAPA